MNDRLARLRAALHASSHLEVHPPATPVTVGAFEARLGITLPASYRTFLLEIADGIEVDGEPWLYPLDEAAREIERDRTDPTRPFWYGDADADALRAAIAAVPSGGSLLGDIRVMELQRSGSPDGCLTLGYNGGNDFSVLVVTGKQAGFMWRTGELDAPEWRGLYTENRADLAPLDFLEWFELWAPCTLGVTL